MKGIVIYKSKYGATAQYASWLAEALYLPVADIDRQPVGDLQEYDYIMIGSPVYVGKMLIRDWMRKNQAALEHKKLFLFVVCANARGNNHVQEIIIKENVPMRLLASIEAQFLPGRVVISKLSWFDRMLLWFRALVESNQAKKQLMRRGFDSVKREHVNRLIKAALHYSNVEILR